MNENYVSAIGWLSLVCSHATACVSEGAFPWLGLRRAGATVWGCGATAACRSDRVSAVRPRQPCTSVPPSYFENFRQTWQKCVAKFGNARPRPKQDKYVRTRSTSVKKERRGFPSRDLIDTNPCFTCQLMRIFFSKDQRANHLTPHRLINGAPCKPTFSLPHACRGY